MTNPKLSVIIPVYENEDIGNYVREIYEKIIQRFKELNIGDVEFIVAEDGSKDNTRNILRNIEKKYGLTLNLCDHRRGYIKAVKDLYAQAGGEYIFFADSDRESQADDFWKLWDKMQSGDLDIVVGYKNNRRPYYRLIISRINNFLIGILFNVWLRDANCGFKIIKRDAAKRIIPLAGNLSVAFNADCFIIAKKFNYSYGEVPIKHFPRDSVVFPLKKMPLALIRALFELFRLKFKILKTIK